MHWTQTLTVILKLVEGMQELHLHKKVMRNGEHESNEAEVVRALSNCLGCRTGMPRLHPSTMPTGCCCCIL